MHCSSFIPSGASVRPSQTFQNGAIKYSQRLLPQVVEIFASEDPRHVLGMAAKSEDLSEGFISITTAELARAVDFAAHWIDSLPHLSLGSSDTIGFIGSHDFRYWVLELAAMKTGHPLVLPSTKNALPNTVSLLEMAKCKVLFYSGSLKDQAVALLETVRDLEIIEIPNLEDMVTSKVEHYPYTKSWEEAKNDIVMIVHTSGSTSAPKPIFYTNDFLGAAIDNQELVPPIPGRNLASLALIKRKKPFFASTPFFHLSGILIGFHTMLCQSTTVMCPPNSPPTGKLVRDIARTVKLNGMITVPSLLDAMFSEDADEIVPFLREIEHICWLGGTFVLLEPTTFYKTMVTDGLSKAPLGASTGKWITKHTKARLWQIYGSTEIGPYHMVVPPQSHWQYMEFHPIVGPTMERLSPDSDLYEVVSHRQSDPIYDWSRPVFSIFPEHKEWRSKDILSRCKDPGFENLWKYEGRLDDMMILSNGLKVNPLHIETRLQSHPALKGCLVIGEGYKKCGLLIEPKDLAVKDEDVVEKLWPAVEHVNSLVPEHARIEKELVVVATPGRPFPRASKGTIIRSLTTVSYKRDIEEIYSAAS